MIEVRYMNFGQNFINDEQKVPCPSSEKGQPWIDIHNRLKEQTRR